MSCFSITFCDQGENHVGMQKMGKLAEKGYSLRNLKKMKSRIEELNSEEEEFFDELEHLDWDTKAKMYGRVVNKHARYNLCIYNEDQEPDYESGCGIIIARNNPN